MFVLFALCAVGLGLVSSGIVVGDRPLRVDAVAVAPLLFLLVVIVQSLPLPLFVRGLLDPKGNALLFENDLASVRFWPLSLDPEVTRKHVGTAAAALAVFLVAYHLASGRTRRHVLTSVVGLSGVAAVFIGLGHRLFNIPEIYGLVTTPNRSLLAGPFVNSNHTAEFLELATFACLGSSFRRNTALNRYGWLVAMVLCAAGAIATFSRGSILALLGGMGLLMLLRYLNRDARGAGRRAAVVGWAVFGSLLIGLTAFALGAGALVDRFREANVSEDVRFRLWRDSLRVLQAHPMGIGRGAFERVYPVYRTLKSNLPLTFAFVESYPLQLLIDMGWLFFGLVVAGIAFVVRQIVVRGRRDRMEGAFLAGLFAVAVHSTVDFGLETLGVLLPFVGVLGTVLGRCRDQDAPAPQRRVTLPLVGLCIASLIAGMLALASSGADDFDRLLRNAHGPAEARAVLLRAQQVHPTDYFYALAFARTEPLKPNGRGPSPRLHALNRALRLCPSCEMVHMEVARSLWTLGLRQQSLGEWRAAVQLQPGLFQQVLRELSMARAKPEELAAVAAFDPRRMVETADFLAGQSQTKAALVVLDEADAMGAPRDESLLTRCRLQLLDGQVAAAQTTSAQAHSFGIQDPRLAVLDARLVLATKGAAGADEAFGILDLAAMRYPLDLDVQRLRISIVSDYGKWQAADRAIDGMKLASYRAAGSALEATLDAARIRVRMGQWTAAFTEYRIALAQSPNELGLWVEFARAAEGAGRDSMAREAYSEAARLAPRDPGITDAIRRIDARGRSMAAPLPGGGSVP